MNDKAKKLRNLAFDAVMWANTLDERDAGYIADHVIDHLIIRLRNDQRVPKLSRFEWELELGDRNALERELHELAAGYETPFDIAERVLEALGIPEKTL
jgi:hypothetical protein